MQDEIEVVFLTKKCSKCKQEKSVTQFYHSSKSKDGYFCQCKECADSSNLKNVENNSQIKDIYQFLREQNITTKVCTYCQKEKDIEDFGRDKYSPDGLNGHCKQCLKEKREINKKINQEKENIYLFLEQQNIFTQICTSCRCEKVIRDFRIDSSSKNGLCCCCRECEKGRRVPRLQQKREYMKVYSQEHKQERKEYNKQYRLENREKLQQSSK